MEAIENYPHYRFMAFADDDDDDIVNLEDPRQQQVADYQRIVFEEDGLVHKEHMKLRRMK